MNQAEIKQKADKYMTNGRYDMHKSQKIVDTRKQEGQTRNQGGVKDPFQSWNHLFDKILS